MGRRQELFFVDPSPSPSVITADAFVEPSLGAKKALLCRGLWAGQDGHEKQVRGRDAATQGRQNEAAGRAYEQGHEGTRRGRCHIPDGRVRSGGGVAGFRESSTRRRESCDIWGSGSWSGVGSRLWQHCCCSIRQGFGVEEVPLAWSDSTTTGGQAREESGFHGLGWRDGVQWRSFSHEAGRGEGR